ncbi:hypothetical protein G647_08137 [Cladophialophora carrionii CBS 160.54]|uniref:Dicer-like protein 2 n=1 Tax=Cladophialophora carrionii CBS 160.54 TaxID=1279043 RepID=V9D1E6_9EURO|nr:uncharacterized protein G647_08137 [Cladophialophora carrionii CBS 160.54]ETI20103.1 hypothetical protein G647_08137 [Cladophialophora carrionii CBS 160.54]
MDSEFDETWSDTSEEDERRDITPIQSRAYQIEMFEHSMKGNVIAVMATGIGKTQIAKLRIQAELERSPNKLVWFTAPSVVLAYQQYRFLSQHLPAYQFRLITGMDNAEYWTSLDIWRKVLYHIHVVVSTPAILQQALNHGFVAIKGISLLIFDEAHHCVKDSSMNAIMRHHYHPKLTPETLHELPHVLGLSASPITKKRDEVADLENNLNAKCKSPLLQLEEYTTFVNMPEPLVLTHSPTPHHSSDLLDRLTATVCAVNIEQDPAVAVLRRSKARYAQEKLEKILRKQRTPAMEEMQALVRSCTDIQQNLGAWACDMFIKKCVEKVELTSSRELEFLATESPSAEKSVFIACTLKSVHLPLRMANLDLTTTGSVSSKVKLLVEFLRECYQSDLRCLIFVKTRPTAWSLTDIINNHPLTQVKYRAFSFVGVSNPTHRGVCDFADLRVQHDNLESFRRGGLNVCVATSVLEEGVDVPAMNLVICFDERPNFRSFVQSRGRARQRESRFVMFPEAALKRTQWQALEDEMNEECQKSLDSIEHRERMERVEEADSEIFRIPSTGAVLTFAEARQHLDRFCARLPNKDTADHTAPVFILEGQPGVELHAKVYLPSSLPPCLRTAKSRSSWLTEKRAKQDAAFQAYRALYDAGLVTDHLLPSEVAKDQEASKEDDEVEKRDSLYDVQKQYNPWPNIMELWEASNSPTVYAHRLTMEAPGCFYPCMLLLLPVKLSKLSFSLFTTKTAGLKVTIGAGLERQGFPLDVAQDITFLLLTSVLQRRLTGLRKEHLPSLFVPDIEQGSLSNWYGAASTSIPMIDFDQTNDAKRQSYLVQGKRSNVPFLWQPNALYRDDHQTYDGSARNRPTSISVTLLPRTLEYLQQVTKPESIPEVVKVLLVDECSVLGLPSEYGTLMLFIPSVMHVLEVALRSAAACEGPLTTIGLDDLDLVSHALTLPGASHTRNYERFEFIGDAILKFYAALHVFADHLNYPAYHLTRSRGRIINNARLQRATRVLGLDQYLSRRAFAAKEWAAGVGELKPLGKQPSKELSSKTLADVVEAVIGVASVSGGEGGFSEEKVLAALKLFIGEVPWRPLSEIVAQIHPLEQMSEFAADILAPVEDMIGYSFQHRSLLAEALTQSSLASDVRSTYDRLEFLGDSVLDYIVVPKLFHSSLRLGPDQMSVRRAALVSHQTLAFFAQKTCCTRSSFQVHTDPRTKKSTDTEQHQTIYLTDYIRQVGNQHAPRERQATLSNFCEIQASILEFLGSGTRFPWTLLSRLGAPKSFSDIIESILAAVFIDSRGNLGACEVVLETMGYMSLVRRFANERDIDTQHPESKLHEVIQTQFREGPQPPLEIVTQERKKKGEPGTDWRCRVMIDGKLIARVKHASCSDEARYAAAERAVEALRKKRKRGSTEVQQDAPKEQLEQEEEESNDCLDTVERQ